METFLPITYLNDFIFCPYSIYLHRVFDQSNDEVYSAAPQQKGKSLHRHIDDETQSDTSNILKGIYVISNKLGIYGKIDTFYVKQKKLVESKYHIKTIYQGYYYQIWAQYFALIEMGYDVQKIHFFSIKDRKKYSIPIPGRKEFDELRGHIRQIARFDFESEINVNPAKCRHCIYAALCDKTNADHVYT